MKSKDNRLFVFMHGDSKEQQEFIKECDEKGYFAQEIKFMVRQKTKSFYPRSIDDEPLDEKVYLNGERPCFTVSNATPDKVGEYYSWTYLESAIETGWRGQFGEVV